MKLCNIGHKFDYELEKLIRIFLPFEKIEILHKDDNDLRCAKCIMKEMQAGVELYAFLKIDDDTAEYKMIVTDFSEGMEKVCERNLAICLYECFCKITGYIPKWGILTGVRPAKLYSRLSDALGVDAAEQYFSEKLKVSTEKILLCSEATNVEKAITSISRPNSFSLYLSIPFCPSRCSYCSFVSHSVDRAKGLIPKYVELLIKEIEETAKIAKEIGLRLETVYMGGGTPTILSASQMDSILKTINNCFDLSELREYTVEAGRPDTVTAEKLNVLKENGVSRISINPQTLNNKVLEVIGRHHTAEQAKEAFYLARSMGFSNINMDLIAGLPEDTFESFTDTIERIIALSPESVTVHSLSMKRAAHLTAEGHIPEIRTGVIAAQMVDYAKKRLSESRILPYYMYRQSKTVGNLENVGYAKKGFECLYNVLIMEETHSILACGASAVTKLRQPTGNYIERIFNFKYPYEYINRFEEQLLRKRSIIDFYEKYPIF